MLSMKKLSECGVKIIGGQIMTRVTANTEKGDEVIETRKVLVPKCIHSDGTITAEDIARWSGTISYEVLLSCGSRVPRILKAQAENREENR